MDPFQPTEGYVSVLGSVLSSDVGVQRTGKEKRQSSFEHHWRSLGRDDIKKYFLHGFAFSVLMMFVLLGWTAITSELLRFAIIGILFGLFSIVLMVGFVNFALNKMIWNIDMSVEASSILINGLRVLLILLFVNIPNFLISYLVPGTVTTIMLFVVYCFVDGYFARNSVIEVN